MLDEFGLLLGLLIFTHLLFDYPLQGDFMAKAKNHKAPIPGVPWRTLLLSHAFMHAAAVMYITGSLTCAVIEFGAHTLIDYLKCDEKISFNQDQLLHIAFKVGYAVYLVNSDSFS